jgi:hypothetical protein
LNIRILQSAFDDLDAGAAFYERQAEGLGSYFNSSFIGMKTLLINFGKPCFNCLLSLVFISSTGCNFSAGKDLSGTYVRNVGGLVDTLVLNTNGSFLQTIAVTNGGNWTRNGTWILKSQVIEFDSFLSAFDFERKTAIVPPEVVALQSLWVEHGRLAKNEYEPKWVKK